MLEGKCKVTQKSCPALHKNVKQAEYHSEVRVGGLTE